MASALAAAWAALVLIAAWARRPPARVPEGSTSSHAHRGRAVARRPWARRWRCGRPLEAAALDELPDVVDLLLLAVGSGLNVHLAVRAVAARSPPVIGHALAQAGHRAARGVALADALEEVVVEVGETLRPLVVALTSSLRYGTPVVPALERVSAEARADRRRRAEEAARRVPVKLLFPLIACILPAFAALTVLPLLASTLESLRL
jgi:tight adherence protein C